MPDPERLPQDIDADLGFGSVVTRESRRRLLNRDGSFNVRREGLNVWQRFSAYHVFVTMSWPRFIACLVALYVTINVLFAFAYIACGDAALTGFAASSMSQRFLIAFFFSVKTIATIGYTTVVPLTLV